MIRLILLVATALHLSHAFCPQSPLLAQTTARRTSRNPQFMADGDAEAPSADDGASLSLEQKMKAWDASEEELKAATLGGVIPGGRDSGVGRTDAFDVGLYIAFPIMVLSCLAVSGALLILTAETYFRKSHPPNAVAIQRAVCFLSNYRREH